jgi:hypothetical protein
MSNVFVAQVHNAVVLIYQLGSVREHASFFQLDFPWANFREALRVCNYCAAKSEKDAPDLIEGLHQMGVRQRFGSLDVVFGFMDLLHERDPAPQLFQDASHVEGVQMRAAEIFRRRTASTYRIRECRHRRWL